MVADFLPLLIRSNGEKDGPLAEDPTNLGSIPKIQVLGHIGILLGLLACQGTLSQGSYRHVTHQVARHHYVV